MSQTKKLVASVVAIVVLIAVVIASVWMISSGVFAQADGTITLIVTNQDEEVIFEEEVKYFEGDTFKDLLLKHLEVELSESEFGSMITSIEGIAQGNGYWWVYVRNGEWTTTGVDDQPFSDQDIFTFSIIYYG